MVLFKPWWYIPLVAEDTAHQSDEVSGYPIYQRITGGTTEEYPPVLPVQCIVGHEEFIHACHHPLSPQGNTPQGNSSRAIDGGVVKHSIVENNLFVRWVRTSGRRS